MFYNDKSLLKKFQLLADCEKIIPKSDTQIRKRIHLIRKNIFFASNLKKTLPI